jgi:hypothetical protein
VIRLWNAAAVALAAVLCASCETLEYTVAAVDQALYEVVPIHPVTGRPVPNLVTEEQEVRQAGQRHQKLIVAAQQQGVAVDPPGERLNHLQRVFWRLVAVAHRQQLAWQAHLIEHPKVNAFTIGGGYVYVYEGLYGNEGLVADRDDDELAAVLAHEIAHVALLHVSLRETWQRIINRARKDPFYSASFTTEQEAEADRLGVLYMALAGYDSQAGVRIWTRAHQRSGSDPAKYFYRHDHPLDAERVAIVQDAATQVMKYYAPGQRNPQWAEILVDNPLFPRAKQTTGQPGAGLARAVEVVIDAKGTHERAKDEAKRREKAAYRSHEHQSTLVRLLATKAEYDAYGRPMINMQFQNGAIYNIAGLGVRVTYLNGQTPIAQDPNCGGPANIQAGQTVWLACPYHYIPNANAYSVEITGVSFHQ